MKRILVADDIKEIVQSTKEMLLPYYLVDTASTGLEVVKLFNKNSYDCLIIDVDFRHGINGLEIVSRLREKYKFVKIIIFSATDYTDAVRQQAISMGATFCEKPLRVEQIHKVMEA